VPGSHCLGQAFDDIDIQRLEDRTEVENLTLSYPIGIHGHTTFD